jgi:serine/threonine protein phosphatase PrpC
MLAIITSGQTWKEKVAALVRTALENGGPDNITAMIVIPEEEHR